MQAKAPAYRCGAVPFCFRELQQGDSGAGPAFFSTVRIEAEAAGNGGDKKTASVCKM